MWNIKTFAESVRQKYPDAVTSTGVPYTEVPDEELTRAMVQKYPVYTNQIQEFASRGGADTEFKDLPGNILPSAGRAIGSVFNAVTHPIETGKAIVGTVKGAGEAAGREIAQAAGAQNIPEKSTDEEGFNNLVGFFKDRYGSPEAFKETLINDPAGVALDVSTLLSGGASAAGKTGTIAKVAGIAEKATAPTNLLAKGAGIAKDVAGKTVAEVAGLTTGTGGQVIREAFRNPSPEFTKFLRGEGNKRDLVDVARGGLNKIKDKRAVEYQKRLANINDIKSSIDISPLHKKLDAELARFGVKVSEDGSLDFSRATISDPEAVKRIQGIAETVKEWGTQKGDRTPIGLDLLKRRLDDFYSDSSQAKSFVASLKGEVRDILNKEVPGYAEMTGEYAKASQFVEDVEDALKLGGSTGTETAINRITQGLNENKEYRTALIKQLEEASGKDITPAIAGAALNTWLPRGLVGRLFAGGAVGGALLSPPLLLGLATATASASPRVVGEVVRALGIGMDKVNDITTAIEKIKSRLPGLDKMTPEQLEQAIYQAGRVEESANQE